MAPAPGNHTYALICTGAGGIDIGQVTVLITPPVVVPPPPPLVLSATVMILNRVIVVNAGSAGLSFNDVVSYQATVSVMNGDGSQLELHFKLYDGTSIDVPFTSPVGNGIVPVTLPNKTLTTVTDSNELFNDNLWVRMLNDVAVGATTRFLSQLLVLTNLGVQLPVSSTPTR